MHDTVSISLIPRPYDEWPGYKRGYVSVGVNVCISEGRLYLKADIKYGKCQVVSKVSSILRQEEEVVMEGEEHEVEEAQEVWPDVDCLIGTHEGTAWESACADVCGVWVK